MLYNTDWDSKTKPSIQGLIAWLETKDPTETYWFVDSDNCAFSQYMKSIDQYDPHNCYTTDVIGDILDTTQDFGRLFNTTRNPSFTFGELLTNIKAFKHEA